MQIASSSGNNENSTKTWNWPRCHCAPWWSSLPVPCIVVIRIHVWRNASIHQDQAPEVTVPAQWRGRATGYHHHHIPSCSSGAGEFRLGNCPLHLGKCVFVAFYDEFYVGGIKSEHREGAIAPQAKLFIFNCRDVGDQSISRNFPEQWNFHHCEIFIEQNSHPL